MVELFILAEVAKSAGPSDTALTLFGTIITGICGIIGIQLKSLWDTKAAKNLALNAANNAEQAAMNTQGTSNGFVGRVDRKLDNIDRKVTEIEKDLRNHMEWHINHPSRRGVPWT